MLKFVLGMVLGIALYASYPHISGPVTDALANVQWNDTTVTLPMPSLK